MEGWKVGKTTRTMEGSIYYTLLIDDEQKLYIPRIKAELVEKRVPLPAGLEDAVRAKAPEGYQWADKWAD